jgi:hypothetical protein
MPPKNIKRMYRKLNDGSEFSCTVDPKTSKIESYKGNPAKAYKEMKRIGHPLAKLISHSRLSKIES